PVSLPARGPPAAPTLSLHDALPISSPPDPARRRAAAAPREDSAPPAGPTRPGRRLPQARQAPRRRERENARIVTSPPKFGQADPDRKSTRLNSSHVKISYAVFCLKK